MQSAADVLKNALFNEVKASAFYAKAAEITQNDASRMVFLSLSDMEDDHARVLIQRAANAPCAAEFDASAYLSQLEATMDATITVEENELLKTGTVRQVLEMAVQLESTARDTYLELAEKAQSAEVKEFCQLLAKEEDGHLARLTRLLQSLDMDEDDRPGL